MNMKIYSEKDIPRTSKDDVVFSVDVIVYLGGILNIGYYDYEDKEWQFHTDTFIDPKDNGFNWIYCPKELKKGRQEFSFNINQYEQRIIPGST